MEALAEQVCKKEERIHRVGSITAGIAMVLLGILFILYELRVITDLVVILKLWPTILIGLGIEILVYNAKAKHLVYDKGAVFILILMTGFSLMMASADMVLQYVQAMTR